MGGDARAGHGHPHPAGSPPQVGGERQPRPSHPHTEGPHAPRKPLVLRDNTVFIGKKNAMSYVLAIVAQFSQGSKEVKVKARGKAICRAVDVSQIVKNRFVPGLKITMEDVSTEEMVSEDGSHSKVSSLTLLLSK